MRTIFAGHENPGAQIFWVNVWQPGPHYGHRAPTPFKPRKGPRPSYRLKVTLRPHVAAASCATPGEPQCGGAHARAPGA